MVMFVSYRLALVVDGQAIGTPVLEVDFERRGEGTERNGEAAESDLIIVAACVDNHRDGAVGGTHRLFAGDRRVKVERAGVSRNAQVKLAVMSRLAIDDQRIDRVTAVENDG